MCDSTSIADQVEAFLRRDSAQRFYPDAANPVVLNRTPKEVRFMTTISETFVRHLFRGAIARHILVTKIIGEGVIGSQGLSATTRVV